MMSVETREPKPLHAWSWDDVFERVKDISEGLYGDVRVDVDALQGELKRLRLVVANLSAKSILPLEAQLRMFQRAALSLESLERFMHAVANEEFRRKYGD